MNVMLGSGGFRTPQRIAFLVDLMKTHFAAAERILFVPYALADHDGYVQTMIDRGINAERHLEGIHRAADPVDAVEEAQGIFIGGGNTFRLLADLYRYGLLDAIRRRVADGVPYLGVSAGSNVACPTIMTTNDMPITRPPSFDALGLVPFQLNPHYVEGQMFVRTASGYEPHFGETRDDRIREFHEMNAAAVIGLWEAGVLLRNGKKLSLLGTPARIFRRGQLPRDVQPGESLDELLES
jgi:dipeptidase E